jgi:hypothetical protein
MPIMSSIIRKSTREYEVPRSKIHAPESGLLRSLVAAVTLFPTPSRWPDSSGFVLLIGLPFGNTGLRPRSDECCGTARAAIDGQRPSLIALQGRADRPANFVATVHKPTRSGPARTPRWP